MKRSLFSLAMGIMASLMLGTLSVGTHAATIWEPTDTDVRIIVTPGGRPSLNGGELAWFANDDDLMSGTPAGVIGSSGGTFSPGEPFLLGVTWNGADYYGDIFTRELRPDLWVMLIVDGSGNRGVVLANGLQPVPLPAAALLFASALGGLVVVKRRKS